MPMQKFQFNYIYSTLSKSPPHVIHKQFSMQFDKFFSKNTKREKLYRDFPEGKTAAEA